MVHQANARKMSDSWTYLWLSGISGLTGFIADRLRGYGKPGFSWGMILSNLLLAFCFPAAVGAFVRFKAPGLPVEVLCGICGVAGIVSPLVMDGLQMLLKKWVDRQGKQIDDGKFDPPT